MDTSHSPAREVTQLTRRLRSPLRQGIWRWRRRLVQGGQRTIDRLSGFRDQALAFTEPCRLLRVIPTALRHQFGDSGIVRVGRGVVVADDIRQIGRER